MKAIYLIWAALIISLSVNLILFVDSNSRIERVIKLDSIRSAQDKKYRDSIFVIISDQEKKILKLESRKKSVETKIKVINQTTELPDF